MKVKKINDNVFFLELAKEVYQKKAILETGYKFSNKFHVQIISISELNYGLYLKTKNRNNKIEDDINEFCNELVDQQLRLDVEKSYGNIRDLLVKQAFSPVENMENEIKVEKDFS